MDIEISPTEPPLPFREALKKYQRSSGMEATGEITPEVVKSLLGADVERRLSE